MKSKKEIKELLLENCVNERGVLELSQLDFSDFNGDVMIDNLKIKRNLYQHNQKVEEDLFQEEQKVGGNLIQSNQIVKGNLIQNNQKVEGDLLIQDKEPIRIESKKVEYFIKLWDNEKIKIDKECYEKLEYGLWIDVCKILKIGAVSVPLKNIKLWYSI